MSKTKEFYHEQICKGLYEDQDFDHAYEEWENEQTSNIGLRLEAEDLHLVEEAEKAEFFRVFEASGRYPM